MAIQSWLSGAMVGPVAGWHQPSKTVPMLLCACDALPTKSLDNLSNFYSHVLWFHGQSWRSLLNWELKLNCPRESCFTSHSYRSWFLNSSTAFTLSFLGTKSVSTVAAFTELRLFQGKAENLCCLSFAFYAAGFGCSASPSLLLKRALWCFKILIFWRGGGKNLAGSPAPSHPNSCWSRASHSLT